MSAALFIPDGGSYWQGTPEEILGLPAKLRIVAKEIWQAILRALEDGQTVTTELVTDAVLSSKVGWSKRYVQYGLWILEHVAKVIKRTRQHGRRIITIVCRLRGAGGPPPQTPQKSFEREREKTSTGAGSSSSLTSPPPNRGEPKRPTEVPTPELVARAQSLIPDVTPSRVEATVGAYGADWVSQALDQVEKRNRHPDKLPVKSWRYVLGILQNWKEMGGPPKKEEPKPAPVAPSKPDEPSEEEKAQQAQGQRKRAIWDALTEQQREEVRALVRRDSPHVKEAWTGMFEATCIERAAEIHPGDVDGIPGDPRAP